MNIVTIQADSEIVKHCQEFLRYTNIGKRGDFDGNKRNQLIGLIGQLHAEKWLKGSYKELLDGFDGGIDFNYCGNSVDVKTMERKGNVRPSYVNNLLECQMIYNCDIILFTSVNSLEKTIEICGWIYKDEIKDVGNYYEKGSIRNRLDGSSFELQANLYEIPMVRLKDVYDLKNMVGKQLAFL